MVRARIVFERRHTALGERDVAVLIRFGARYQARLIVDELDNQISSE
jgi:hypothetical protein